MENTCSAFDEIHVWKFPKGTTVNIEPEFIIKLTSIRKLNFRNIKTFHERMLNTIPFATFKNYLKRSFPTFRDLHVLLKVCEGLEISAEELERNVIAYQFKKSRVTISSPILPIKVTPLFPMLIAHMIADGTLVRFRNKKTIYFSYRQYDRKIRLLLLRKLESLFGTICYKEDYFSQGTRLYIPEVLTLLLCNYYGLDRNGFLSETAVLPEKIVGSSNNSLLAVLIAFIIDEGHIDSSGVVVSLKNEKLIEQLSRICNKLSYKNTIGYDKKRGMSFLYILKQGTIKFWKDYLQFKAEYPAIDLCYKENKLKADIERFGKNWKSKGQNKTKNLIIQRLKRGPATCWDLAKELNISRQGIRNHTRCLLLKGILSREKVQEGAFLYSLEKEVSFEEALKGQSLPIGKTAQAIKLYLSQPKTTIELIKELKMCPSAVRASLWKLQSKGEVLLLGKKPTRTMPTKIWGLPRGHVI